MSWNLRREIHLEGSIQHAGVPGAFPQACVQFSDSCRAPEYSGIWGGREAAAGKCCPGIFLHCLNNKVFLFSELSTTRTTHSKQSIKCRRFLQYLHLPPSRLDVLCSFIFISSSVLDNCYEQLLFPPFFSGGDH